MRRQESIKNKQNMNNSPMEEVYLISRPKDENRKNKVYHYERIEH